MTGTYLGTRDEGGVQVGVIKIEIDISSAKDLTDLMEEMMSEMEVPGAEEIDMSIFGCVVLHEFGHAMGLYHEHQNPNQSFTWNREVIYEYYERTHGWDAETVDGNILGKLDPSAVSASDFDAKSIMIYSFPPVSAQQIEEGFKYFADMWHPILDVFDENGVKFGLEVHPTEIAFDIVTAQRAIEAVGGREAFGFNFDPSHLFWNGVDPVAAIRKLGNAIFHVHGKDVYVEKPFVLEVAQAEELIALAEEAERVLMVGHLLEYHPVVVKLKEMIESNELGEIYYIYSQRLNLGTDEWDPYAFDQTHILTVVASLVLGVPIPDRVKGRPGPGRTKITQERVEPEAEE